VRPSIRPRGFTLLELMTVVAVIGILATAAYSITRSALKNARLDTSLDELVAQVGSLRAEALTDMNDRLLVLVDAPTSGGAMRLFVLRGPTAAWTLSAFDPTSSAANVVEVEEDRTLNDALQLATVTSAAPAPLQNVTLLDPAMMGSCAGRRCFALRFRSNGDVRGELPSGGNAARPGFGFVISSNLEAEGSTAAKRRAIVIGFPSGVVKSYVP
jgi:prepilin-type N-terminal cleavage/methylation domain-containing protein